MARKILIAIGSLLFVAVFWAGAETIDIYRYQPEVPPIDLDAKYKTGEYAPLENPINLDRRLIS